MSEQLIISVGREFASGGHVIAEQIAKTFNLPLYDRNILGEIAGEKMVDAYELEKYDEVPRKRLLSRSVRGYSNSPEENIANMQFEYLIKKAEEGKSFVVVGRCSEVILKEYDGFISIFILGDKSAKKERIMNILGASSDEAEAMMKRNDKKRKEYHNYYCNSKWGDSRNYDISINSSKLGIDKTAKFLEEYIRVRTGK